MNRRVVAALAVVGVTVGTVAAALATSAAFSTSEDSSAAAAVAGIGTVPEVATSSPGTSKGSHGAGQSAAAEHTYSVRDAGRVVVRRSGSGLAFVAVVAHSGWKAEGQKADTRQGVPFVEVGFVGVNSEIVFTALLVEDEIITRIEDREEPDGNDGDENEGDAPTTGVTVRNGKTTSPTSDDDRGSTSPTINSSDDDHNSNDDDSTTEPTEPPEPAEPKEPTEPTEPPEPVEVEH
jgi:hypothetical protein